MLAIDVAETYSSDIVYEYNAYDYAPVSKPSHMCVSDYTMRNGI